MTLPLLLASSSTYRRALLQKLDLPFNWDTPNIDESSLPGEQPTNLTKRLAQQKARVLARKYPAHLIIGSDQVCVHQNMILGKPHNFDQAFEQLKSFSGKTITFHTGLCLLNSKTDHAQVICEPYDIKFRNLSPATIAAYLKKEEPYDCAGSIKTEALGISLIHSFNGEDPNSLIGLPLIKLIDMLQNEGVDIFSSDAN